MVAVKIENFGGMLPATDSGLLPDNMAGDNRNTWMYSGALRGFNKATEVHTMTNQFAQKVFRIPKQFYDKDHIVDSYWLEFTSPDVDVVRSPTVNDSFERYYWAGAGVPPQYNTKDRIAAGSAPFQLGIPAPPTAPALSTSGGAAPVETRSYVYTWVSAYGEEGPPSLPVTLTGNGTGSWAVTLAAPGALAVGRNIAFSRIYRTVTGTSGSTAFFLVTQLPVATLSYTDTTPTTTVTSKPLLDSTYWSPPPDDLEGIVMMPNGIMAGWAGSDVWFTEPYRPHAWPSNYTLSLETPIVGMGVIGQSLIVCTSGSPYTISGVNPASMAVSKIAAYEPCQSRGSIVSTAVGVVYASANGLALAVPGSVSVLTRNLISKDLWLNKDNYLSVSSLRAAAVNGGYYCWGSLLPGCFQASGFDNSSFLLDDFTGAYAGAFVDVTNPRIAYSKLFSEDPTYNCFTDSWTGEVMLIRGGKVYWLDLSASRPHESYKWRSKVFETPEKRSFGAMRVYFRALPDTPALNPVQNFSQSQTLAADQWGLARVYADDKLVFTRELRTSGELFRLPSGFKAMFWEIEIEARVEVNSIEFASTAKELGSV